MRNLGEPPVRTSMPVRVEGLLVEGLRISWRECLLLEAWEEEE